MSRSWAGAENVTQVSLVELKDYIPLLWHQWQHDTNDTVTQMLMWSKWHQDTNDNMTQMTPWHKCHHDTYDTMTRMTSWHKWDHETNDTMTQMMFMKARVFASMMLLLSLWVAIKLCVQVQNFGTSCWKAIRVVCKNFSQGKSEAEAFSLSHHDVIMTTIIFFLRFFFSHLIKRLG